MDPNNMLLQLSDITKSYDAVGASPARAVLDGLNLTVKDGESIAIIGPSGSGKSTLLNLIGALDKPTQGSVAVAGQDIAQLSDDQLAQLRNQKMGFIFQAHHLLPQCTVLENVLVPTLVNPTHRRKKETEDRARRLLDRVGLKDHLAKQPGLLSGGERQRVAVVRALINQPALLLADEPTGALDQTTADELVHLLIELNQEEGVALIVVTHSIPLAKRMGRLLQLRDGKLHPDEDRTENQAENQDENQAGDHASEHLGADTES
jgi:ABC-type lipoprotein export system ATPase subunit